MRAKFKIIFYYNLNQNNSLVVIHLSSFVCKFSWSAAPRVSCYYRMQWETMQHHSLLFGFFKKRNSHSGYSVWLLIYLLSRIRRSICTLTPTQATVGYRQEIYLKHRFANVSRTPERSMTRSFTATTVLSLFHT